MILIPQWSKSAVLRVATAAWARTSDGSDHAGQADRRYALLRGESNEGGERAGEVESEVSEGVVPFILSVIKIFWLLALIRIVQSGLNPNTALKRSDRAIRVWGGGFLLVLFLAGFLLYLKP